ncbi:MAG: hypothetical protein NC218_00355 [Acetobacter sp.]|nr:hypothetical protein [Acetobacter sp.]
MKNSESKFSNDKSKSNASSNPSSKPSSGCCCGSKLSDDIEEIDVMDIEEK